MSDFINSEGKMLNMSIFEESQRRNDCVRWAGEETTPVNAKDWDRRLFTFTK